PAAAMEADLVTLVGGLNDVLRPGCDTARVCALLEESVATLAPACGTLVLMRSPGRRGPVLERYRARMEQLFDFVD
ncbi:GDSL family lipase, partial [Streptomyces nanshensis]